MGDEPLAGDQAKGKLVECLAIGKVMLTGHFRQELANDNLTMGDVRTVCRSGAVINAAEPDLRTGDWKYRIEGRTVDGCGVAVVFKFASEGAVLITVWKVK